MPQGNFRLYSTPEETLQNWARELRYIFNHLDVTNISIGTDDIKDYMIDFGTGLQQVDALDVPIVDSTGKYSSTSVEGALEEIGRIVYGSSGDTIINSSGYCYIDSTNLLLKNPVIDDCRVPVTATKTGGSKDPGFEVVKNNGAGSQGVFSYKFDASLQEELFFTLQFPHTYKPGTAVTPHVHWFSTSTGGGNVVWGMEYTWAGMNTAFSNTAIISTTGAAGVVPFVHHMTNFVNITPTSNEKESSMLIGRIYRDSTHTGDTLATDAVLLEIDFHHDVEKFGTIT